MYGQSKRVNELWLIANNYEGYSQAPKLINTAKFCTSKLYFWRPKNIAIWKNNIISNQNEMIIRDRKWFCIA